MFNKFPLRKIVIIAVIILIVRAFLIDPYSVPSESMAPTIKSGEIIFISKIQYGVRIPFTSKFIFETGTVNRGDIVVFKHPYDPTVFFTKRVIGLPNDNVRIEETGQLYINDEMQNEPYLAPRTLAPNVGASLNRFGPVVVDENSFFMLGDNRDNSADSRHWGVVPRDHFLGKVVFK